MRISKAKLITEDDIKLIPIGQMTKKKYIAAFKGKLFCPTEHCSAKLSYSSGKKGHYKTWRYSNHSPTCPYNLERDGIQQIGSKDIKLEVNISKRHKQSALMRAYKSMMIDEINGPILERNSEEIKNNSHRKVKTNASETAQMTLFGGAIDEDFTKTKGKKLLSRFVHEISPSDIGKNRIIKGFIKDIELLESTAELIVGYQNEEIAIVFMEHFKTDPLNKSYVNKFWAIKEWMSHLKAVTFIGVGEVQFTKDGKYELYVSMGTDFKVDGEDMYNLARKLKAVALS
ncbi:hypothetical protein [Ureibacillus chungkukjangi]|uniref:Uncharacterized protein n=1 Tax=Ureibacillus chungkukjangi TaxID=1202712 RepID=A0A318UA09_9BACL|nr:hypothetical protein [Ureibacillus chungkukjangi]MCM3389666.1 hypothetical protein [Ureibacillus chungkukjangi]PYF08899.1 hypothetical protein BJ095_101120 [Ureibacillus chungkukjangi]